MYGLQELLSNIERSSETMSSCRSCDSSSPADPAAASKVLFSPLWDDFLALRLVTCFWLRWWCKRAGNRCDKNQGEVFYDNTLLLLLVFLLVSNCCINRDQLMTDIFSILCFFFITFYFLISLVVSWCELTISEGSGFLHQIQQLQQLIKPLCSLHINLLNFKFQLRLFLSHF